MMTPANRDMLIRTVLGESEDESADTQAAVAHSIINQVGSGDLSSTVMARGKKPWMGRAKELNAIDPESDRYKRVAGVVDSVLGGQTPDPTGGATRYVDERDRNREKNRPAGEGQRIGDHTFYGGGKDESRVPAGPMSYADEEPDLASEWLPKAKGNAKAPAAAAAPAEDDLLSEWLPKRKAPAYVPGQPAQAAAAPAATPAAPTPGLPQAVIDLVKASQGHGYQNLSGLITGSPRGDSWGDTAGQFAAGSVHGLGTMGDTLAQGITAAGDKGAGLLSRLGVISPESAQKVSGWRGRVNKDIETDRAAWEAAKGDRLAPDIGEVAGQIAGTAPLLAAGGGLLGAATRGAPLAESIAGRPLVGAALRGAGQGAGAAALTSASSDQPLDEQLRQGAIAGGAFGVGGKLLGKVFGGGGISRETADLADKAVNKYGIPLRPDQVSENRTVRLAGGLMQRAPFTGVGGHAAEQQGAWQRAISREMGEDSDKLTRGLIKQAKKRIGPDFDDVAKRTGAMPLDRQFLTDVGAAVRDARISLGDDAAPIEDQVQRIAGRIRGGSLDNDAYQSLTRKGTPFDRALQSKDPNTRFYAGKLESALDDLMARSAPADVVDKFKKARYQWAIMKAVEPLAKKGTVGNISPKLLLKQATGGNLEELGEIGKQFIAEPSTSNTAENAALLWSAAKIGGGLAGVGGALGAAAHFDPDNFQSDALKLGAGLLAARTGGAALTGKFPLTGRIVPRMIRKAQQPPAARLRPGFGAAGALENRRAGWLQRATSP
jgi:hypothetical protein